MQAECLNIRIQEDPPSAQVVKSHGITTILTGPDSQLAAEPLIDSSAVKDSLDTLAGVAVSSQEGHIVCLESSAGPAACSALQVHLWPVRNASSRVQQLSKPSPFMSVWPASAVLQTD